MKKEDGVPSNKNRTPYTIMKKVLFVIPTLGGGGAEHVLVNLVNHMNPQNFDITVQTIFNEGINRNYLNSTITYKSNFKHQFRGSSRLLALVPAAILYKFVIREQYDIIISFLEGISAYIVSGCRDNTNKKIAWFHTEAIDKKIVSIGFPSYRFAKKAYSNFDKIVCVSNEVRKSLDSIFKVHLENSCVKYNVIDYDVIIEKAKEKVDDTSFEKDTINIISAGKLQRVKGFDRLLSACARMKEEGIHSFHCYILGEGEDRENLEQIIKRKNLEEYITLLGFKENPYKYIASCDIYICSSRREGFSSSVAEALILKKCVISTKCSGTDELLGNDEFGIVVTNSDDGIYYGLKRLVLDKSLLNDYTNKAKEKAISFQVHNTVNEIEHMLEDICQT